MHWKRSPSSQVRHISLIGFTHDLMDIAEIETLDFHLKQASLAHLLTVLKRRQPFKYNPHSLPQ